MTAPSAHDAPAPAIAGDADSFPSHAELVRTLLGDGGFGLMTTITDTGYPYGSLAAYSTLDNGDPLVLISEMAAHTRNAHGNPKAGLFVTQTEATEAGRDPLDAPRASVLGDLAPYQPTDAEVAAHLAVHPGAAGYLDYRDFGWWRLTITTARFIAGFGSMSWVPADQIAVAEVDPVMPVAAGAVRHMNADHADATLAIARFLAGVATATAARVHDIDRHGVTLHVDTPEGFRLARVAFADAPLASGDDVRSAVVELTKRARAGS